MTVVCESGYLSPIATRLLQSKGLDRSSNVMGGMDAIRKVPQFVAQKGSPRATMKALRRVYRTRPCGRRADAHLG